jgi:hypothetical protein
MTLFEQVSDKKSLPRQQDELKLENEYRKLSEIIKTASTEGKTFVILEDVSAFIRVNLKTQGFKILKTIEDNKTWMWFISW